jgi:hypothetical protein
VESDRQGTSLNRTNPVTQEQVKSKNEKVKKGMEHDISPSSFSF